MREHHNKEILGGHIDLSRRNKGYTQQELADLCHVTPKTIQLVISGARNPSLPLMAELCMYLDMPADCLFHENRKGYALNDEQIQKLKEMPDDLLKQVLSVLRALYHAGK